MLGVIADIAAISAALLSAATLTIVLQMSSVAKGKSSQAANQSVRARDVSNSEVRQTANKRPDAHP